MERLKLSMAQVREAAGEGMPVIYAAMRAGHLETFVVGRRRFATPDAVRRWVDFLRAEGVAGRPINYRVGSRVNTEAA